MNKENKIKYHPTLLSLRTAPFITWNVINGVKFVMQDALKVLPIVAFESWQKSTVGALWRKRLDGTVKNPLTGEKLKDALSLFQGARVSYLHPSYFCPFYTILYYIYKDRNGKLKEQYDELMENEKSDFPIILIKYIVNQLILKNKTDDYKLPDKNGHRSTITPDQADKYHRILSGTGIQKEMAVMLRRPKHYGFEDGLECEEVMKVFFGLREIENYKYPSEMPLRCLVFGSKTLVRKKETKKADDEDGPVYPGKNRKRMPLAEAEEVDFSSGQLAESESHSHIVKEPSDHDNQDANQLIDPATLLHTSDGAGVLDIIDMFKDDKDKRMAILRMILGTTDGSPDSSSLEETPRVDILQKSVEMELQMARKQAKPSPSSDRIELVAGDSGSASSKNDPIHLPQIAYESQEKGSGRGSCARKAKAKAPHSLQTKKSRKN